MLAKGFRNRPPADLRLLDEALVKVSNMIIDFPEIKELDINPLVLRGSISIALDARVVLDEQALDQRGEEYHHLIISPYPTKYVKQWHAPMDGRSS